MPDFATTYANYCGTKLPETPPKFPTNYFPAPREYITVHSSAGQPARFYDYWNKAISLILPELRKHNIEVIQIGGADDPKIFDSLDFRGKTTFRQCAYIVENSLCHVGADSCWIHVAGSKETPFVALYSSNPSNITKPHYLGNHVILDADLKGNKHSFMAEEYPKTINTVKAEDIANSIAQMLNLDWRTEFSTVWIGALANLEQIDLVPNFQIPPNVFVNRRINIRMDIFHNEQGLGACLQNYKAVVTLTKPVSEPLLINLKKHIPLITYILDSGYSKQFVAFLHRSGIPYQLITEIDGEALAKMKLDLFDYNQIFKKTNPEIDPVVDDSCYFETHREFFSEGKFYPTKYHLTNKIDHVNCDWKVDGLLENQDFLENLDNYYIYKNGQE